MVKTFKKWITLSLLSAIKQGLHAEYVKKVGISIHTHTITFVNISGQTAIGHKVNKDFPKPPPKFAKLQVYPHDINLFQFDHFYINNVQF